MATEEVGDKLADSLLGYFSDPMHLRVIEELKMFGLKMELDESKISIDSDILSGKTIVISGNFTISREELKALIERNGGKVGSSISGNTTYMIAGEKSGPSKMQKAQKLGVEVISEEDFYRIIK